MTQINIPSNWSAPKFTLGQQVEAEHSRGHIIGLEYAEANHTVVTEDGLPPGWYYIIQGSREAQTFHESQVHALAVLA
jgi:hypothetical protein